MFRKIEDFVAEWPVESEATLKVLRVLTDGSLQQRVGPDGRSLGRLAWHVTQSIPEMMNRVGLSLEEPAEDAPIPEHAAEIVSAYEHASRAVLEQIRDGWGDEKLVETSDMYGAQWANGLTLEILIRHQSHHRGQMTVLMRQAGLTVPGVYGPAREEWVAYGMAPQE